MSHERKRNINTLHSDSEDTYVLTKGDNNQRDDRYGIYNADMEWLRKEHIIGRVQGILPYVGMVTIIMNDYPWVKV
jgi:signal peptidase